MPERSHNSEAPPAPLTPPHRPVVESQLRRILDSSAFKSSQRSRDFLCHVVRHWLDGDTRSLHERAIAVDLLGRPPSFDPSEDAIVRVQANEVRKRLARFYETSPNESSRIELPPGGYIPLFLSPSEPGGPGPSSPPSPSRLRPAAWMSAAAFVAVAAALVVFAFWHRPPLDDFWRPAFSQGNPVIICVPGIAALRPLPGSPLHRQLTATRDLPPTHQDVEFDASAGGKLFLQDNMVGMGAALGALRVAVHLGAKGKPFVTRIDQDVSFADLRSHPAVLLGALSSKWTIEMKRDLPFDFDTSHEEIRIVRRAAPSTFWVARSFRYSGRADEDYAIAARVIDSTSGQIIYIAAGISTYGTQAAAECLVDAQCIERITASAPADWPRRNVQAVLHTRILGNTPGPPHIVASEIW